MTNHETFQTIEPPIQYWFIPRTTPLGGAPEEIKSQWVNLPLPVRVPREEAPELAIGISVGNETNLRVYEDSVSVLAEDALKSLRLFNLDSAADWWEAYFEKHFGSVENQVLAFDICGDLVPAEMLEMQLPGINEFDHIT